ncbi:MAG TPA: GNAT family N-acetyltransferase [Burkholderiales bacterium]|nr:GNAT family N-acetyltransferase [Burkholderiales bacterium]
MFCVRLFIEDDRQALETIYQTCRAEATWLPTAAKQNSDFARDTAGEKLLVAVGSDEMPLGFLSVWEPDRFIHHLYVRSDMRGRGVGKALLEALGNHVPAPWTLKCLTANDQALAFYASQGWRKVSSEVGEEGPYFVLEKKES